MMAITSKHVPELGWHAQAIASKRRGQVHLCPRQKDGHHPPDCSFTVVDRHGPDDVLVGGHLGEAGCRCIPSKSEP